MIVFHVCPVCPNWCSVLSSQLWGTGWLTQQWYFLHLLTEALRLVTQKIWDWITDLWSLDYSTLTVCALSLPPTPIESVCGMG